MKRSWCRRANAGWIVATLLAGLETVFNLTLFGGLKLPSGDASALREEVAEQDETVAIIGERLAAHETGGDDSEASGIHGHDLALGSGSVDGVLGARVFGSWDRLFFSAAVQYMLRTEGSFNYQYADDLAWRGGPGVFLLTGHQLSSQPYSLRARAVLSGETKGKDRLGGAKVDDTAITSLYVGPGFVFTWGPHLAADFEVDIPVVLNNTSLQIVPSYRLRGGLVWRF